MAHALGEPAAPALLRNSELVAEAVRQARIDLAACFRIAARLGMHEGICNHFSLVVPGRDDLFLVNPYGWAFSEVTDHIRREADRIQADAAAGRAVVPEIPYADIRDGKVSDAAKAAIRRTGCAVVRGVYPEATANDWFAEVGAYLEDNHYEEKEIEKRNVPWHVSNVGARAEFVCAPTRPKNGAEAKAAMRPQLELAVHLYLLNRGVLIAPFHNMTLLSPATTADQVDHLVKTVGGCLDELKA